MRRRSLIPFNIVLALAALAACPETHAFEAGAARVNITPPLGTPLLGVAERMGRGATSVHAPLYARALYLSDGETPVMLVAVDLYEINSALRRRVLELAPDEIPRAHIILSATGTHSGPGAMESGLLGRQRAGRYIEEVFETTASGIAESMRQALGARQRGAIGYALADQTTLFRNATGGPLDEQIGVLRVDDADGNAIAIVANCGVRADFVADLDSYAFSSDLPGLFCDELEKLTPAGCVGLFLNGPSADHVLANPENLSGWEQAVSVAKVLAVFVKGAANQVAGIEAVLSVRSETVRTLPVLHTAQAPRDVLVQQLNIGDAAITFLPGSPSVRTVLSLRARAAVHGIRTHLSAGPANGNAGALLSPTDYRVLPAREVPAPLGPGGGAWAVRAAESLMAAGTAEEIATLPAASLEQLPGATFFEASGDADSMGRAWGRACAQQVAAAWDAAASRLTDNAQPGTAGTAWWPRFLDDSGLRLEAIAGSARGGVAALPPGGVQFIAGIAAGTGLPFDAVWLTWNARELLPEAGWEERSCAGLTFAILGDQAGADDALAAQLLAGDSLPPLSATVWRPAGGQPVLQLTETGGATFFAGMNGAGVLLCVDRFPGRDAAHPQRHVAGLQLRAVLESAEDFDEAAAALRGLRGLNGYRLLLGGLDGAGFTAAYVEPGVDAPARRTGSGLLTGSAPEATDAWDTDPAPRIAEALGGERIVDETELQDFLTDEENGLGGSWSRNRRLAVVLVPKWGTMHFAVRQDVGGSPAWTTVSFSEGPRSE